MLASAAHDERAARPTTGPLVQEPTLRTSAEEATRLAIDRGLAYLARRQADTADGSFPKGGNDETREWAPIGVTALGVLGFMAGGHSPYRGPFGREVARAVDYLLLHVDLTPRSQQYGYVSHQGDILSRMHGHGYATLALAQAYGMSPPNGQHENERLKKALTAAVRLIEQAQGPEGGWTYQPRASGHEGSVTICLVQALRAARNVGIRVDSGVITHAEDYVEKLQNENGLFRYQLDRQDSSVALTAAAITTLNMTGRYDTGTIDDAVNAIWTRLALRTEKAERPSFPFYERLHLAQAFWQLSDQDHFRRWFERERKKLLRTQRTDGSWRNPTYGDCYATAVNCLVLAIPDGLLPIFQR